MNENLLIAIIVGICVLMLIRKFTKQFKGKDQGCGCSCEGCDTPAKGAGTKPPMADGSCQGPADDCGRENEDKS